MPKTYGDWDLVKIKFTKLMKGRSGLGKENDVVEPRIADFYGGSEILDGPVPNENFDNDFDMPTQGSKRITADDIRVIDIPPPPDAKTSPSRYLMTAVRNARADAGGRSISADRLTYDSEKDLFYGYGENGRSVKITDQRGAGQPLSTAQGRVVKYNHKTGAAELIDPNTVNFFDAGTGVRPIAEKPLPDAPTAAPKRPLPDLRPPPLGNIERKGFTGR